VTTQILGKALTRDAQRVTVELAREMPAEVAAAWVHSAALVQHAVALGLIDDRGSVLDTLKAIADAHPELAGLADPDVNRAMAGPVPDLNPVDDLWTRHSIADRGERPDGYALGDLYQALSEESRKGRALCQTPRFVTDLLLDLAFDQTYQQWGTAIRAIDPACGTGHILMEGFLRAWSYLGHGMSRKSCGGAAQLPWRTPGDEVIAAAMAAVAGVDLDPYAAAVARYRLLAMACRINGSTRTLADAPREWVPRVACADSLLDEVEPLLQRGRYHVVLANPPYITVKDANLNEAVRRRYPEVCHRSYSLALPFAQLMTELLVPGGWCAQLTTNSFMKREFGKKFVDHYLPRYDLRWVIDTSGVYIPGHGTPTVIMVHRNQAPTERAVSTILGVKGEPGVPEDPAKGLVWTEIGQIVRSKLSLQRLADGARRAEVRPILGPSRGDAGRVRGRRVGGVAPELGAGSGCRRGDPLT
jgi:hypothetical protein